MKNRILTFIIGVLTGAIIMTLVFLIINKPNDNTNITNYPPQENGEMQRPNGDMEEPPAKPDGNMQMPPR